MYIAIIDLVAMLICELGLGGIFTLVLINAVGILIPNVVDLIVSAVTLIGLSILLHRVVSGKCTLIED